MPRPSVLFINRVYPPLRGATGRVLQDMAQGFARDGWDVSVLTTGPRVKLEMDGAVKIYRIKGREKPNGAVGYMWTWLKLYCTARTMDAPHMLVTMTDPPLLAVAGQRLAQHFSCRHIHWCQDYYPEILPALGMQFSKGLMRFFAALSTKAMSAADRVIVIGRCMARKMALQGFSPRNITFIPNWPNQELTTDQSGPRGKPVQHYSDIAKPFEDQLKSAPKFRVLYAGNLGKAHPIETIIEAAYILNTQSPEIEFVFVGDGAKFDELAKTRQKLGLDNIRLLPYQPPERLKDLMESGDVHLVSMTDQAAGAMVPCKLYSALAAHRPCVFVGPATSEAAKVITDFNAGTVVPQGRAEDLAARIKHLRLNSNEWFTAYKGAQKAAQIYTAENSIGAFIERAWAILQKDTKFDRTAPDLKTGLEQQDIEADKKKAA